MLNQLEKKLTSGSSALVLILSILVFGVFLGDVET